MEKPVIKDRPGINPVWILPVVALLIGGWLLYRSVQDAGIEISVRFEDASGITPNKTQVMYKGIPVGVVRDLRVSPELESVDAIIEMEKETRAGLVEDTSFWLVRPEVSGGRVQGLDTLISGSYITAVPGTSKESARRFIGHIGVPPIPDTAPGLHVIFETDALRSIQKNSTIFHRNVPVGRVRDYEMRDDGTIRIRGFIEPRYTGFVREGTRFWNASGLSLKGDLTGLKFHMESLSSLLMGGIAFDTPEALLASPAVSNGHTFKLYNDYEDAEYGLDLTLRLASGEGIREGSTKVMYQGLVAGTVKKVTINRDAHYSVTAHILLDPRAEIILREGTRFWAVRPQISASGIEHVDTLIKGAYITFEPGDGPFRNAFDVEPEWKPYRKLPAGREYALSTADSHGLSPGAPVYYRKIQVGEVTRIRLTENTSDDAAIDVGLLVYERYRHLIRGNTVFWNIGGLDLRVRMTGIDVRLDTLRTLVRGGIALAVPPEAAGNPKPAKPGTRFPLYETYASAVEAVPALKPGGLRITLETKDVGSLRIGSPVLFRKIRVGEVVQFRLDDASDTVRVDAFIDEAYKRHVTETAVFYMAGGITVEGSLAGLTVQTESIESIVAGGIAFENNPGGAPAANGRRFTLYPDRRAARSADRSRITVRLPESGGLRAGSPIRYQGIDIGEVLEIDLGDGLAGVVATAAVRKKAAPLFRTDTRVWLEAPRIGLGGIRNAETVLTGPYLAIAPGPGDPRSEFTVLDAPPDLRPDGPGLELVLETPRLGSLSAGAPIYYRQVRVGEIVGHTLADTADRVLIHAVVYQPYAPIIRDNTKFWNASGIRARAGLFSGVRVDTESVRAVLAGGVALATPDNDRIGTPVSSGHRFILHDEPEPHWLEWAPTIPLDLPEKENEKAEPVAAATEGEGRE